MAADEEKGLDLNAGGWVAEILPPVCVQRLRQATDECQKYEVDSIERKRVIEQAIAFCRQASPGSFR